MCKHGDVVPNNSHFDTTRANVRVPGAVALDLPCPELADMESDYPFKGDMDVARLRETFAEYGAEHIPLVMITVTNNSGGGQPVSLANVHAVAAVCREFDKPLYLDACRIAENAYFIKHARARAGRQDRARDRARDVRPGRGLHDERQEGRDRQHGRLPGHARPRLARQAQTLLILTEGFPTYGGLSGRDLEALAIGMQEGIDEDYLHYRIVSTRYIGEHLRDAGVPLLWPPGGHAIYLDAKRFAPHLEPSQLPGISVAVALYELGGVRACEIGTLMFGKRDPETGEELAGPRELVRLAIPRRVYTQSHMDYVIEVVIKAYEQRDALPAYRIVEQPPFLRHFSATLERVG